MSSENKNKIFVEENITISSGNKAKKDKDKKIPLIKQSKDDKNDITIELSHHKKEEDERSNNSAEFSTNVLKNEKEKEKAKTTRDIKPITLSQKAYDKYTERLKEKTMKKEIEKINQETERIKQKFEEKNSYLHLFSNNPQFQKMVKFVEKQLFLIFIIALLIGIFSGLIYFNITRRKMGIALANFTLSILEISIFFILIISLKLGLLKDPELSKAFRLFVIIEFLVLIASFVMNILIALLIKNYLKKNDEKIRIIVYILFGVIILLFIISFKYCFVLFFESLLILLNKKTEYSILMINEQNSKSDVNIINSFQTSNNISTEGLINNSTGIINANENNNQNNKNNKEEEQYRNFNYFNKFHYSVTNDRKDEQYFNKI